MNAPLSQALQALDNGFNHLKLPLKKHHSKSEITPNRVGVMIGVLSYQA